MLIVRNDLMDLDAEARQEVLRRLRRAAQADVESGTVVLVNTETLEAITRDIDGVRFMVSTHVKPDTAYVLDLAQLRQATAAQDV